MPLYGYACTACGPFAVIRPIAQFQAPAPCPECGAEARRVVSAPALLGHARRHAVTTEAPSEAGPRAPPLSHQGCRCCR
ncbi:MAG: zinc ribbon domain-containing protein [Variovorax sp.]|nr:MAG: zinc ribbon domain-containing protein [Variovorax sp.]